METKYEEEIKMAREEEKNDFMIKLFKFVVSLFGKERYSDVTLVLEGGLTMRAHQLVLFSRSEFWMMKTSEKGQTINLSDVKYATVMRMLKWVYTDELDEEDEIGWEGLLDLIKTASQFNLLPLLSRCENAMMSLVNEDNCRTIIKTVEGISVPNLIDICSQLQEVETKEVKVKNLRESDSSTREEKKDGHQTYACNFCPQTFTSKNKMSLHKTRSHRNICSVCHIGFKKRQTKTFMVHSSGTVEIFCHSCSSDDKIKAGITRYVEKKHACDICGQAVRNLARLIEHKRIHTGEKNFTCEICGHSVNSSTTFRYHMDAHYGIMRYKCDDCGRLFGRPCHLKRHMLIHSGEKPFQCSDCGKLFRQINTLHVHRRTHTGEKPFSCSTCGKSFSERRSLLKHKNTHSESQK